MTPKEGLRRSVQGSGPLESFPENHMASTGGIRNSQVLVSRNRPLQNVPFFGTENQVGATPEVPPLGPRKKHTFESLVSTMT